MDQPESDKKVVNDVDLNITTSSTSTMEESTITSNELFQFVDDERRAEEERAENRKRSEEALKMATDAMNLAKKEKKKGVVTRSVVSKMARHVNLPESSDVKKLKKMVVKESSTSTSTSSFKQESAFAKHVKRGRKKLREEEEKNKSKKKFAGSSFVDASFKKPGCNF